jgi:hypothetical protein
MSVVFASVCLILHPRDFLMRNIATADAEINDDQTIKGLIEAARGASVEFGNLHVKIVHQFDAGKEKHTKDIKLWSREGKYFRVDSTVTKSTNPILVNSRERIIVRPEGFVRMASPNQVKPLAIVNFGSNQDGLDRIQGEYFFEAAIRVMSVMSPVEYFKDSVSKQAADPREYSLSTKIDGDIVFVELGWSKDKNYSNHQAAFDRATGYCKSSSSTIGNANQPQVKYLVKKDYEKGIVIPTRHVEIRSQSGSPDVQHSFQRVSFEDGPAPLGVFSLDAQGVSQGNVWVRRLLILSAALVLLGIYFAYRRVQNRA